MSQDKQFSDNQSGYNQWSSFYDSYPNPTVAIDELSFPRFWQTLTGKDILEIGCGTGRHTQKLVAQNNRVVGIDISEGMLQVAREKIPPERALLVHADFMTYDGFHENQFDAIVASLVIEHIQDLSSFFKRAAKFLKPGGELYLSEIHPERTAQGVAAHFKNGDHQEIHLKSHPHTDEDFQRTAAQASLETVKNETIYGTEEFANINSKWTRHLGKPMIEIWVFRKGS
ncbi:class I SAM-dependent methyltransferase [uncultured Bdellovibrio sp.]|uniref:class I SAM-dependent methyltransferase n=1 Tax=Bdellovibrio sp. HCB-162 TaxID=3394234 RepID=UPI0025E3E8F1|nr:class I SAM-dependent methyltransferase [uncultured Bdellovibrio sp.]